MDISIEAQEIKGSCESHAVRITSGGKIRSWVDFSLKFFKENPGRPLTLHTLPFKHESTSNRADEPVQGEKTITGTEIIDPEELNGSKETSNEEKEGKTSESNKRTSNPSSTNIPRLISVVEIIKREFLKELPQSLLKVGLYQYNYLGYLEESSAAESIQSGQMETERAEEIVRALSGKSHLKRQQTPFMKTLLSTVPIEKLDSRWSYQEPISRKIPRSAKRRLMLRQQKQAEGDGAGNEIRDEGTDQRIGVGGTTT